MAAGDTFSGKSQITVGSFLTVQPAGSTEAVIHNLLWDASSTDVRVEIYDGSSSLVFFTDTTGAGGLMGVYLHVTNALYIRVKNNAGSTGYFSYDGMYTK